MFSGGKDSAALVIMLKNVLSQLTVVHCRTGWELKETDDYIGAFNYEYLDGHMVILQSEEYKSMPDLIFKKNYVPTVHQRFCTEELKIKPIQKYLKNFGGEVHLYNGVRAQESLQRRNAVMDTYDDVMKCWVHRPLLHWTDDMVFEFLRANGIMINPLYTRGFKRVGCGPCIMISLKELAVLVKSHPDRIDAIRELEKATGQFYFKSNYIPEAYRTGTSSNGHSRATIDDVIKYLDSKPKYHEITELAETSCMSYYNLCE